eukprot:UN25178
MIAEGELDNLIFINCLGTEDAIQTVFGVDIDEKDFPDFRTFIFDFHKPVHLSNVHSKSIVWVVDTEESCKQTYPKQYVELDDEDDSEEFSDSDEEFDDEDEGDVNNNNNKRTAGDLPGRKNKRRKLNMNADKLIERQRLKRRCEEYYHYTSCRLSSSFYMYQMGTKTSKDDNAMLWCGIVGTTKLFLNQQMSGSIYNDMMEELQGQVLRRNNPYVEPELKDGCDPDTLFERRPPNHIQFSQELKLVLLHHWTIFNSMFYSPIIAAKLGLWKADGKKAIDFLLAKMSLPQKEAHQEWDSLAEDIQKTFFGKFEKHAIDQVGQDMVYASFTKQHGDYDYLRAGDMVFAITALLEDEKAQVTTDDKEKKQMSDKEIYACVEKNFKTAMDSLDICNQKSLKRGLKLATKLQKTTADKALDILNNNRISSLGIFRVVFVDEKNEFYTPISISKLSQFIQTSYQERLRDKSKKKPLVAACWNDNRNTFTVCGVPSSKNRQSLDKNPFGCAFRTAAQAVKARVRNITFETYLP